ncbi:helix-turn-helix domain-containing protein [Streptoverticillium reticulum]|uniref:helix-turn-helix domain-containing protein n=1 Tax=Streptoverticillium reticulum TaxID=1433415 RepID=UPI0039BF7B42
MPKVLRVALTEGQRHDLHVLLARRDLTRYARQPAECIRLLGHGRTIADVAGLLGCNPVTVRAAIHRFEKGGIAALPDAPRPGRPAKLIRRGKADTGADHVRCGRPGAGPGWWD